MNVLHRERILITFFRIEADRYPLNCSNIVHRTSLIKIRQRDMTLCFIYLHRRDRRWNLLNQRKMPAEIIFIRTINKFFQC